MFGRVYLNDMKIYDIKFLFTYNLIPKVCENDPSPASVESLSKLLILITLSIILHEFTTYKLVNEYTSSPFILLTLHSEEKLFSSSFFSSSSPSSPPSSSSSSSFL
jgi:hypothetical protein